MSKYLVNTSQGALFQTLNQLYVGRAFQVRLPTRFLVGFFCLSVCLFIFLFVFFNYSRLLSRRSGFCEEVNPRFGSFPLGGIYLCAASRCVCSRKWQTQTHPFAQSNSSVYAFYNDAPPVLDYIQGYGHTKGTAWLLRIPLLLSPLQTIPKPLSASPRSKEREQIAHVCC